MFATTPDIEVVGGTHLENHYQLSSQQLRILESLARGDAVEQITLEVHWSQRTVKRRIDEIMAKLGAKNGIHMLAEATRRGFIRGTFSP
jgi:DNA-binding NarL/FixJ family response regulator